MTFYYPWDEVNADRNATYREVIRLNNLKQQAARQCNFSMMKKIEIRVKELRRKLGYRAWGKS